MPKIPDLPTATASLEAARRRMTLAATAVNQHGPLAIQAEHAEFNAAGRNLREAEAVFRDAQFNHDLVESNARARAAQEAAAEKERARVAALPRPVEPVGKVGSYSADWSGIADAEGARGVARAKEHRADEERIDAARAAAYPPGHVG